MRIRGEEIVFSCLLKFNRTQLFHPFSHSLERPTQSFPEHILRGKGKQDLTCNLEAEDDDDDKWSPWEPATP